VSHGARRCGGVGVGSSWVGFYGLDALHPLLAIPGSHDVFAIIPCGDLARATGKDKKKRKGLGEVTSCERFSKPYVESLGGS